MADQSEFWHGQRIYAEHVLGLVLPGQRPETHDADPVRPGALTSWTDGELPLMIEEGRRQLDRQQHDFERVQARAQWLFTVAAAVTAAVGTMLANGDPSWWQWTIGLTSLALLVWGVGGTAAIIVVRADFRVIHAPVLSHLGAPVNRSLAEAYSGMMATGGNTVATRLTILRQAMVLCLAGGYLGLVDALLLR